MAAILSVLAPIEITPSMLVSSSVPENDYVVWSAGASYGLGVRVISTGTHKVYESAQANNTNHDPTDIVNRAGAAIWWIEVSATNRWNMFDSQISTQTSSASPLTVVLKTSSINSVYLVGLDADAITVTVKDATGGAVVFSFSAQLECSYPGDYYEYCFAPFKQQTDILIENIPAYLAPEVSITLSKTSGNVKCGALQVGDLVPLGRTVAGAKPKPKSYSYIKVNDAGESEIKRRKSAKDLSVTALVALSEADSVLETITSLLDVPCVWIASASPQYSGARAYGLGSADLSYEPGTHCILNLTVIGLI